MLVDILSTIFIGGAASSYHWRDNKLYYRRRLARAISFLFSYYCLCCWGYNCHS